MINIDEIRIKEKILGRKKIILCVWFVIIILLLIPLSGAGKESLVMDNEGEKIEEKVSFSLPSGFYADRLELKLHADKSGEILYTMDGSRPDTDNPAAMIYNAKEGIILECDEKEKVYTIRAAFRRADGSITEVQSESYIVGTGVGERYDIPVLLISGDQKDLTDEDTGVFAGENRFLTGRENEKTVHAVLLSADGDIMLSQGCGLRIHGASSRQKNQPSFRLYARKEYDGENRFNCLLYEDYSVDNTLITGCKSVILRNGGNDNGYAHLRTEFACRVCNEAGFLDAHAVSPVCVYINGEYFGVYWFVENYDDSYFENKYGEYDGEVFVMEGGVSLLQPEEGDDEITLQLKEEYNQFHEDIAYSDLSDEVNWRILNETIDVENFVQYMAIQNYLVNTDALVNNFKTYRYYSAGGEYHSGTVYDGRYRFLLYDLDETMNWGLLDSPVSEVNILSTANRMEYEIFYNALFSNILSRQNERDLYISYYLSLLNYYFADRGKDILDEMHESHAAELYYQYTETNLLDNNFEAQEIAEYDHVISELGKIDYFLKNRPEWALMDLEEAFGINGRYEISLLNESEAYISVDYANFHDKLYTGTYFSEVPVTIKATPKCGDKFDYWLVDGVEYYEDTLQVTGDMVQNDIIYIECVTSPDENIGLMISAVKSRGGNDYVELTNFGQRMENLFNYMLADGPDEENMSKLPAVRVKPGESIVVYCKNYTNFDAIGKPVVNFNISTGETVYLYRNGVRNQWVDVPELGTKDGVFRMDTYSGKFYEKKN